MTALLVSALLTAPAPVAAQGSHYDVTYTTTGTATAKSLGFLMYSSPYSTSGGSCHGSNGTSVGVMGSIGPFSVTCTGPITAHFQWNAGMTNDPPPTSVIVQQHSVASFTSSAPPGSTAGGACDNGLGVTSPMGAASYSADNSAYSFASGGQSFSLPVCNPSASASGSNVNSSPTSICGGSASVTYTATATPININPTGTTIDSTGLYNILIGQGCTSYIQAGAPLGNAVTFSNFQWSVSDDTFGGFGMGVDNVYSTGKPYGHVYPVDPSEYLKPNPHWFWKDADELGAMRTISCTAQININGVPIPGGIVSGQKTVKVWTPSHEFLYNNGGTSYFGLGTVGAGTEAVINWNGAVGIPQFFYTALGHTGTWQFTQLCSLYHLAPPLIYTFTNGFYLDAEFNYSSKQGSPWNADATYYSNNYTSHAASDSPSITFSGSAIATIDDYYWTYMMYQPPGTDVSWVPLHKMAWHWNASLSSFNGTWLPK